MNNLGMYKDLFELYANDIQQNTKLIIALLVFICINLIVTVLNIISQHRLKIKDKKIFSFTIKEKKRIDHFEKVYQSLDKLTYFDGKEDNNSFLIEIQHIRKYLACNRLYYKKKELKIINDFNDYFMEVLTDFRNKDFKKEFMYFEKLEKQFNK